VQVGIILTPIFVKVLLGGIDVALDTVDLLVKLIVSILVPLVIGKGLREMSKAVREFVTTYKVPIYMLTNIQISLKDA
jgi:sodium/bile acid cotransporter 7